MSQHGRRRAGSQRVEMIYKQKGLRPCGIGVLLRRQGDESTSLEGRGRREGGREERGRSGRSGGLRVQESGERRAEGRGAGEGRGEGEEHGGGGESEGEMSGGRGGGRAGEGEASARPLSHPRGVRACRKDTPCRLVAQDGPKMAQDGLQEPSMV